MNTRHKKPLVGMRTLKTGMAVILTLIIAEFGMIINPIYAAIGTVLAMQTTVRGSFLMGRNRLLGTLIGGVLAYLFALVYSGNSLIIGVAVIISICVCNFLKLSDSISITLTVLLSILIGLDTNDPLTYSLIRIWDTSIGVVIGIVINYFVAQPNYQKNIKVKFEDFYTELNRIVIGNECHVSLGDLEQLKKQLKELDSCYHHFTSDLPFGGAQQKGEENEVAELIEACHDVYFHAKSLVMIEKMTPDKELFMQIKEYHSERLADLEIYFFYKSEN